MRPLFYPVNTRIQARSLLQAALFVSAVLCASCASNNVNPPAPRAHQGYVDFYAPGQPALSWEVKRWDPEAGVFKTAFSRLQPLSEEVLRLESPPGRQRFQVSFLNRLVEAPATVEVRVTEGMVTPVKIELVALRQTPVVSKQEKMGHNIQGAGRETHYTTQAGTVSRVVASVQSSMPYRLKEQMPHPP